tara:strand:+ start:44 stop:271 length:228 start_codon:yes stop_codon:yes gene_type:complete
MDLRIKAAQFILSGDDVERDLKLLDNANHTIPDEVSVWEKFEYESLETILSYIDDLHYMLDDVKRDTINELKLNR